jgi:hypothetical protein
MEAQQPTLAPALRASSELSDSAVLTTQHIFESLRDRKGILYAIGCEDNGAWKNPVSTKKVLVTASSTYRGTPAMVADHTFACQIFYTDNIPYSWVRIDFKGASVCPNYYSMAHRAGFDGYYLRDWQLQASNDAQQWVVLREHKADESLNKKSLVAAWPLEGATTGYRYFQVVIAPNGNSNSTNALILSCFELYGTLRRPASPPASVSSLPTATSRTGPQGPTGTWQTVADGSCPLPFRVVAPGRATLRQPPQVVESNTELSPLHTGLVVAVTWQGGSIQMADTADSRGLVTYHKSDVWVDDKKVKQLPREGDVVSFYIAMDEITKKEKAEQVTVINRQLSAPDASLGVADTAVMASTAAPLPSGATEDSFGSSDMIDGTDEAGGDSGIPLNPVARLSTPHSTEGSNEQPGPADSQSLDGGPQSASVGHNTETKSSFLFEHCTGQVVFVSVPTGQIKIDGAPDDASTIPYHYSDVWDDGKCVKQFPRVGDTVSCYIGIDPKTKKEKAENVKVICKRQQTEDGPARTQVRQTIQNARNRAAANTAQAGIFRPTPTGPTASSRSAAGTPVPYASPNLTESQAPHSGVSEMHSFRPPMFDGGMGGLQGYSALPVQVGRMPLSFGHPQPMVPPHNFHHHPQGMVPAVPQLQHPAPMLPSRVFPARPTGPFSGFVPTATPPKVQFNAFAPVAASPSRPAAPPLSPYSGTVPAPSAVHRMQYQDGAAPLLFSVGAARVSPPQSPSPSPSTGLSMSTTSSVGTLNASGCEADMFGRSTPGDVTAHFTPSPASVSPFEDGLKSVDVDTLACMPAEAVPEEYHCRTPMKKNSGLSTWTADDLLHLTSASYLTTPERVQRQRAGHEAMDNLLPRSPIIGDILRSAGDEARDEPLDHDLLSGESALVALHAVSVVDF